MTETEANVRKFLRRADAGEYLKKRYGFCSGKTLAKLASEGGGPSYYRAGNAALYTQETLDEWAVAKIGEQRASTAEHGVKQSPSKRIEALAAEIETEQAERRAAEGHAP